MKQALKTVLYIICKRQHIMNYKILMYTTATLILANLLIGLFSNFWGDSNYPDYINSILMLLLIISATQVFSKKK